MKNIAHARSSRSPSAPAVAVPVNKLAGAEAQNENAQLELLSRLTEASVIIRSESEQIKAFGVSDRAVRLLRILGEAVEEQRIGTEAGMK